jgi:predicted ATP-grasp superfamily ATP-dependent carboligase
MNKVLLTYGWVRSSYAALRNLNKYNIPVSVSDTSYFGMCQFSRLRSDFSMYTSHYNNEEQFISDLLNICAKKEIDLIFPSHNETEIISRHKHKFDPKLVSLLPDEKHCKVFNNKSDAYNLVSSLGVPVAYRINYTNADEIPKLLNDKGIKKTVIKLLTGNSGKGVFYGKDESHTKYIVKKLIKEFDLKPERFPQVEEYVEGEGYGCSVLYWKGKFIADFTHRRLRDKIATGGTSTLREASSHQGIEEAARNIFDAIGWNGLAMCEFKVCPKTGKFWFIEVNPRMWGSISLPIEAGVEFPYLAWLCAKKGPDAAIEHQSNTKKLEEWKARWLLGDIFLILGHLIRLDFKSAIKIILEDRANSLDDFFLNDPFVFFGEACSYFIKAIKNRSTNASEKGMVG